MFRGINYVSRSRHEYVCLLAYKPREAIVHVEEKQFSSLRHKLFSALRFIFKLCATCFSADIASYAMKRIWIFIIYIAICNARMCLGRNAFLGPFHLMTLCLAVHKNSRISALNNMKVSLTGMLARKTSARMLIGRRSLQLSSLRTRTVGEISLRQEITVCRAANRCDLECG